MMNTTGGFQAYDGEVTYNTARKIDELQRSLPSQADERKATPIYSGVLKYFPKALAKVSQTSQAGNDQHHPNTPLHWDKSKSSDELDALTRHLIDHSENPIDDDGQLHLAKVAWRALAALERYLDGEDV